ncbi:MAG: ATP-binding protein [Lachnospiraceae bacterium]|nr:ATP-binding protein [Lachnospiraceae bacterium]
MYEIREQLAASCKRLRLAASLASRAMTMEGDTHQDYLKNLLDSEIKSRDAARLAKNLNTAGFPCLYRREQYRTDEIEFPDDVTFESLLNLDFYRTGKNVIMYGGTGTGKTMLSILIGMAACKENIPVRFYRVAALINLLTEHKKADSLTWFKAKKLNPAKILILDEFGYVPYDRVGSQLLFDYLSEIHEQKSVVLNTNLEFSQWVNVLYDKRMTTALIGRLIQHVELILFPGENNRLRESSINQAFARTNSRQGVSV